MKKITTQPHLKTSNAGMYQENEVSDPKRKPADSKISFYLN